MTKAAQITISADLEAENERLKERNKKLVEALEAINIAQHEDGTWLQINGTASACFNITNHGSIARDAIKEWCEKRIETIKEAEEKQNG